jgi:hypothetical protein
MRSGGSNGPRGSDHPDVELVEYPALGLRAYRVAGQRYANEAERFADRAFIVGFTPGSATGVLVNADHEEDAVDAAADFGAEYGFRGFFLDEDEVAEAGDDVLHVGNHGEPVRGSDLWIAEVPHPDEESRRGQGRRSGR